MDKVNEKNASRNTCLENNKVKDSCVLKSGREDDNSCLDRLLIDNTNAAVVEGAVSKISNDEHSANSSITLPKRGGVRGFLGRLFGGANRRQGYQAGGNQYAWQVKNSVDERYVEQSVLNTMWCDGDL